MEADWEIEIGGAAVGATGPGGAAVIDAAWEGRVDLRQRPEAAALLPEAVRLPALGDFLREINGSASRLMTSKCDLWLAGERDAAGNTEGDAWDADELAATAETMRVVAACYVDLLPRPDGLSSEVLSPGGMWTELDEATRWAAGAVLQLRREVGADGLPRAEGTRCCRVDLVVRRAVTVEQEGFGVTLYVLACGSDEAEAWAAMTRALSAAAACLSGQLR